MLYSVTENDDLPLAERCQVYEANVEAKGSMRTVETPEASIEAEYQNFKSRRVSCQISATFTVLRYVCSSSFFSVK